jgi:hypothetical protein
MCAVSSRSARRCRPSSPGASAQDVLKVAAVRRGRLGNGRAVARSAGGSLHEARDRADILQRRLGVGVGTMAAMRAYARCAPLRIIGVNGTGAANCWYVPKAVARRQRDEFQTKDMLSPDKVIGLRPLMKDAVTVYLQASLSRKQIASLFQIAHIWTGRSNRPSRLPCRVHAGGSHIVVACTQRILQQLAAGNSTPSPIRWC